MFDTLSEIWATLSHNKLRTSLTGFAVSWGIFMLIALLGAGNGLLNAFMNNRFEVETNSMEIWPGRLSKPYKGMKEGTWISFDSKDVALLKSPEFSDVIDIVSPEISISSTIVLGAQHVSANVRGATAEFKDIEKIKLESGRFINSNDERDFAKVVVINSRLAKNLLDDKENYRRIMGSYVNINGLAFKVIGIIHTDEMSSSNYCYAPFEVVKMLRGGSDRVDGIVFTFHGLSSIKENEQFEARLKEAIARLHYASPDDTRVAYIWNRFTQDLQTNKAMNIINVALWILGIFTLVSGIVGVSNIMLISVKERTHEFGIRKAIGARPWSILKLILGESVTITAFFGYIGMLLGLIACQVMNATIASNPLDVGINEEGHMYLYIFKDPTVGLGVAAGATILIIAAGTLAGLIPAWKASRVKPIEALRDE
ncbi:MAG: ABC transporter permease [Bacteroidales bacterium]|nr:ABC transporter permease [Bacteroidales bacterium]